MAAAAAAAPADPFAAAQGAAKERVREALVGLSEVHEQEIMRLRDEVRHLKLAHAVSVCARIDEPEMQAVMHETAAELASSLREVGVPASWVARPGSPGPRASRAEPPGGRSPRKMHAAKAEMIDPPVVDFTGPGLLRPDANDGLATPEARQSSFSLSCVDQAAFVAKHPEVDHFAGIDFTAPEDHAHATGKASSEHSSANSSVHFPARPVIAENSGNGGRSGPVETKPPEVHRLSVVMHRNPVAAHMDHIQDNGHLTRTNTFHSSWTSDRLSGRRSTYCANGKSKKERLQSRLAERYAAEEKGEDLIMKKKKAEEITKEAQKCWSSQRKRLDQVQSRKFNSRPESGTHDRTLQIMVEHPLFDTLCAVMIVLNSIMVGYEVQWNTEHDSVEVWVDALSYVCGLFFLVELILRLRVFKLGFFLCGAENYMWNWFDTLLVIFSIVEFLTDQLAEDAPAGAGADIGSGIKAVKMLRIARVFRVFRFFKELSLLALMILDSMKSLMWALLLLSIILYVFAILFTQSSTDYIKMHAGTYPSGAGLSELQRMFGNIQNTVYTLLQAMLGGVSWGVASDALFQVHWAVAGLFFFYIFFTMLAFLNITTGVFVDNAVETARTQRDFLVQKEQELKERYLSEMRDLFLEMDEDDSGTVSLDEVDAYFEDPRVRSYFAALGLEAADTERLFSLLDCNDDGDVSIDEFCEGCLRLKGLARSIDVQHLLMEFKKFNKSVDVLQHMQTFNNAVDKLRNQSVASTRSAFSKGVSHRDH